MQTRIDTLNFDGEDQVWCSIAEFSLGKVICAQEIAAELAAGTLFLTFQELSLPPEYLKKIEGTLTDTARGMNGPFDPNLSALSTRFCLFCSRKTIDSVRQPEDRINGCWGYFVIERSRDRLDAPCQEPSRLIELYLFKEGY